MTDRGTLYEQRVGREFLRAGAFFLLWSVTGLGTFMMASLGHMPGGFSVRLVAALLGVLFPWVLCAAGLAMYFLWHRPLLAGWGLSSIAPLVIGVIGGFVASPELVLLVAGVGAAGSAYLVQRRLPFSYPRFLPGSCPACGYTREHLQSRHCPECGTDLVTGEARR